MSGGNGYLAILSITRPPERVVSLVPSVTDSLYDLGLGEHVVGVTEFCRPPEGARTSLKLVGGTKSTDVEAVISLKPDLVIANQEENSPEVVEALEEAGLNVWVTFPRTVEEAIQVLWALVRIFRKFEVTSRIKTLELTRQWTLQANSEGPRPRVFCPIWRGEKDSTRWWMTFNRETYAHDLLSTCGGENVFGMRRRRYPLSADLGDEAAEDAGERDTRYPRVSVEEVREANPEVVLLPSEPFVFTEEDASEVSRFLAGTPAVESGRIRLVDGSLITWHGTRLARALAELPSLLLN